MTAKIASHQVWNVLPTAHDITVELPRNWTDQLLSDLSETVDWLNAPNTYSASTCALLGEQTNVWLGYIHRSPGALRLRVESAYSDRELRVLYAMLSRSLGYLNNRYAYFFDVQDRGLDYTKEAIPVSKTKAETGYHTDSTAKHYFPDIIGLLCLQPAIQGGESLITNAANLLNHLKESNPEREKLLHLPLCRDVITPGTVQNTEAIRANDIPLFQIDEQGGVVFRYMRYWIESALEKLNEPAPDGLKETLDAIDSYFAQPENAMCFRMDRGEMLFVNNRFLCHNRTAFVDGEKPRVYVRAWINEMPQS